MSAFVHELSIALEVVDVACDELRRRGGARVRAVHMRVGVLSGVVKEALLFSFDVAATGTPIEGARLEIEDVAATVWCDGCATESQLEEVTRRRCPACHGITPDIRQGAELELTRMEIADA